MSLSMLNETMEVVTESNPLFTEHNGTKGETVDKHIFIANQTETVTFKDVVVRAKNSDPLVKVSVSRMREIFSDTVELPDLGPGEEATIYVRFEVEPNSPEKVISLNMIEIETTRYGVE